MTGVSGTTAASTCDRLEAAEARKLVVDQGHVPALALDRLAQRRLVVNAVSRDLDAIGLQPRIINWTSLSASSTKRM